MRATIELDGQFVVLVRSDDETFNNARFPAMGEVQNCVTVCRAVHDENATSMIDIDGEVVVVLSDGAYKPPLDCYVFVWTDSTKSSFRIHGFYASIDEATGTKERLVIPSRTGIANVLPEFRPMLSNFHIVKSAAVMLNFINHIDDWDTGQRRLVADLYLLE
jgi:hypothetical protein